MRIIFACIVSLICLQSSARAFKPGDVPYDVLGKTLAGEEVKVSDYKGKLVIISFWASWCPACRKELPVLSAIQRVATKEKVQVISINMDQDKRIIPIIIKLLPESDIKFVTDAKRRTAKKYDVSEIPQMIIINSEGVVASVHKGYDEKEIPNLVNEINRIFTGKSAD